MKNVHLIEHALIKHSLTRLRNKNTDIIDFRRHAAIVSQIMIMEATRDLPVNEKQIETPLTATTGYSIHESLVFVPVLRAGISMLFPVRDFLPWAPVGFIGLERDELTAVAREYYQKFPKACRTSALSFSTLCWPPADHRWIRFRPWKNKSQIDLPGLHCSAPEGIKLLNENIRMFTFIRRPSMRT
jgi:uracil phosphoribosyltransferase